MDELLFELLAALGELLLEAFLYVVAEAVLDVVSRAAALLLAKVFEAAGAKNPSLAALGYALLGLLAGAFSILIFPHPLLHREQPSRFHGISLLASPIITGLVMSLIGSILRRQGRKVVQIESFRCGFAFALGMALIRFFFAR